MTIRTASPALAGFGVVGHAGTLVVGTVGAKPSWRCPGARTSTKAIDAGRHLCSRVLGLLGVQTLILTNAAGGINVGLQAGRADGDRRSHQPDGHNPLVGPERRVSARAFPT